MSKDIQGASPVGDRAVVNGAASVSALRASVPSAIDTVRVWLEHGRASFGGTIPTAALDGVVELAAEAEQLREWKFAASLTLSDLREQMAIMRLALKSTQGWLALLGSERPETSHVHDVALAVEAALRVPAQGIEAGTGETEGLDAKRESPVHEVDAPDE